VPEANCVDISETFRSSVRVSPRNATKGWAVGVQKQNISTPKRLSHLSNSPAAMNGIAKCFMSASARVQKREIPCNYYCAQ
jgi:hypothetical protein